MYCFSISYKIILNYFRNSLQNQNNVLHLPYQTFKHSHKMTTVTLQMIDELTQKTVSRTIDITNAMSNGQYCWELRGENEQRASLNNWILERGNEQHATILTLVSWSFN